MKLPVTPGFLILLGFHATCPADDAGLPSNKEVSEELTLYKSTPWLNYNDSFFGYMTEFPVRLKAGSRIAISGRVVGTGRKISIALLDPAGQMIGATRRNTDVSGTKLVVEEVAATGTYQILVVSDKVGVVKVKADYAGGEPGPNDADASTALVSGKKVDGELSKQGNTPWPEFVDSYYGYMVDLPVALKAGDRITIQGSVRGAGTNRRMAVALVDPTGAIVGATKRNTDVGGTKLTVEEVAATGTYQVRIVSDKVGAYSVTAQFSGSGK